MIGFIPNLSDELNTRPNRTTQVAERVRRLEPVKGILAIICFTTSMSGRDNYNPLWVVDVHGAPNVLAALSAASRNRCDFWGHSTCNADDFYRRIGYQH
jgi:hypothetical protein